MPAKRLRALLGAVAAVLLATGCGAEGTSDTSTGTARTVTHADGTTKVPTAPQRVVALGEEFLLADLLDLGITPIASTATLGTSFSGLPKAQTKGIEPLDVALLDLERIAKLRPDLLVVDRFVLGQAGYRRLSTIAPTLPLPDDGAKGWRSGYEQLARWLGRQDVAKEKLAAYDATVAAARGEFPADETLSIATAYPSEIVAWAAGPSTVPAVAEDLGLTLKPGAEDGAGRLREGRASIGLERLDLLSGSVLVLLQSGGVDGEVASLKRMQRSPLYRQLPAVRADRVITLDRLGYPGVAGRTRLAAELTETLSTLIG